MHSINGFVYCNGPTLNLTRDETLRVIVMGFGSEVDMHSAVFQGQIISKQGEAAPAHEPPLPPPLLRGRHPASPRGRPRPSPADR
jgi:hypothetical protein